MIAKQMTMRIVKRSNFGELIQYIVNSQNKHERVERITVTNCHQIDHTQATNEILAIQRQNRRAKSDKTYHLMVSFPAGENCSPEILRQIESKVCAALGFDEHQRISAVHTDTDHLHIHIAINKIHPRRLTIHNPYCDHKALGAICDKLELEYGLTHDNHQSGSRGAQSPALDMEHAGGVESLLGWIRRECLSEIRAAGNWQEFHEALQRNGLAIAKRGNGLIITDGEGRGVKPSSVARDLSMQQLENKFGAFVQTTRTSRPAEKAYQPKPMASRQDTAGLYAAYQRAQGQLAQLRAQKIMEARNKKNRLIEAAKHEARQKRYAIQQLTQGTLNRKVLYHLTRKTLTEKLQAVNEQYRSECKATRSSGQRSSWLDWLQRRAAGGDAEALSALRARNGNPGLKGNLVAGSLGSAESVPGLKPDSITKRGTIIYRAGASAVRDDGHHIQVSQVITQQALALSLALAMRRFGPSITVAGTAEFKERAVQFAAAAKLPLKFENPVLEQRRQSLVSEFQTQEQRHESDHRSRLAGGAHKPGRRSRINQRPQPGHGSLRKPHVARIGSQPPPQAKNRLRDLHELGMVHNAFGSELLLPGHVPRNVEQQQPQAVDGLRREVPEPGRTIASTGVTAAKHTIAEREEKRAFIKAIPKHTLWAGEGGSAQYAGWREKDGELLVLLKTRSAGIIVVPVDRATLARLKRLKMETEVIFNEDGVVRKRGRSV